MMKIALAIVLGLCGVAEAGHHCFETSKVVGYRQCHRFAGWSNTVGVWWELGAVALRFDPDPIETVATGANGATYHVTSMPGDHRSVKATGVRFRNMASFGAWYFGSELDFASITDGPQLEADVVSRDTGVSTTMDTGTHGFVMASKLAVGRRARFGALAFGAELAPGARIAVYSSSALPDGATGAAQAWFVLEAQAKADVWIAPNFTLGASAGVDLMQDHDVSLAITLGAHLVPYDHLR